MSSILTDVLARPYINNSHDSTYKLTGPGQTQWAQPSNNPGDLTSEIQKYKLDRYLPPYSASVPAPPVVVFTGITWPGGEGTLDGQPRWAFTLSGGITTTLTAIISKSVDNITYTTVETQNLTSTLNPLNPYLPTVPYVSYTGITFTNQYYQATITATNVDGSSTTSLTDQNNAPVITATGGTITSPTTGGFAGYKVHTFTTIGAAGNFTLSSPASATLNYICVGGGGGGGGLIGGGGGGGNVANGTAIFTVAFGAYAVTIGSFGGGGGSTADGASGGTSIIDTIANCPGGGGGGYNTNYGLSGGNGGGGGGALNDTFGGSSTVAGPFAGTSGGDGPPSIQTYEGGAGGGGAGGVGGTTTGTDPNSIGSPGGIGKLILGAYYGGGGGGGAGQAYNNNSLRGAGGLGGGGNGGGGTGASFSPSASVGTPNTGGGGGGGSTDGVGSGPAARGGAGVAIIYYLT